MIGIAILREHGNVSHKRGIGPGPGWHVRQHNPHSAELALYRAFSRLVSLQSAICHRSWWDDLMGRTVYRGNDTYLAQSHEKTVHGCVPCVTTIVYSMQRAVSALSVNVVCVTHLWNGHERFGSRNDSSWCNGGRLRQQMGLCRAPQMFAHSRRYLCTIDLKLAENKACPTRHPSIGACICATRNHPAFV